ncbi:hypothetical protein H0H87_007714 [Tephrocybe sp. NHM501043]|nr:hypothetical protein H0H87_007714 [Tephrocybe sp. NHM501043]
MRDTVQCTIDEVKAIDQCLLEATSSLASPMRALIPANSSIFLGRDTVVAELVRVITSGRHHVCLLGPGGMGKTSTSLVVMDHPDVKSRFPGQLRVWVPCVKALSVSLFVETLGTSLGVPRKTPNILSDIISKLVNSPPIVILLDNFETPWNTVDGQSEAEQILRDIHRISHVTLVITMRSSSLPCGDIPWHRVDLRAVDAAAARDIYLSWNPAGRQDSRLTHLLETVDHMPLAVILMAKFAALTRLPAEKLIDEYNRLGTAVMGQGLDAKSSMDVCIGLSVNSPLMRAHPEAFELLCTIAMLPTGTSYEMLSEWWASGMVSALGVLRDTSLVEKNGSTYFVLPVIQRYLLHPSRFSKQVHASMINSACTFLRGHDSPAGGALFKAHSAALSAEEVNLEAVLLTVTDPDLHVIQDGFLPLTRHQRYHTPRVDIIKHAPNVAKTTEAKLLLGDLLFTHGDTLRQLRQFDSSLKQLKAALELFLSIPDRRKATECRLQLASVIRIHSGKLTESQIILTVEQEDCKAIGDEALNARCLLDLGRLYCQDSDFAAALNVLMQAEPVLARVNDQLQHSRCLQALATVYYEMDDLDPAYVYATSALKECDDIGDVQGSSYLKNDIGKILSARGQHEASLTSYLQRLEIGTSLGLPASGRALEGVGIAWANLKRVADARQAFEGSLQQYLSEEPVYDAQCGIARSRLFLRKLDNPFVIPTPAERSALRVWYSVDHIDKILLS